MKLLTLQLALMVAVAADSLAAGFLEKLGIKKTSTNAPATVVIPTSREEVSAALKAALAQGVDKAITSLGKEGGFMLDQAVKIPVPDNLKSVERTLRSLRQEKLADEFIASLNRAAERAVPEAASVLGDALKQLSIADATAILTSTNTAATDYFRRTSETNLMTRFLPIVKQATEEAGVTSAYKTMAAKAKSSLGNFGGFGNVVANYEPAELDNYVTRKALDGLFLKIAEQEKLIRENPQARATELLQKVFGAVKR